MATPLITAFTRWAGNLRWPWLFALTATLFLVDLIVPDFIPFADEILLGLLTMLFSSLRKRRPPPPAPADQPRPEPKRVN